MPRGTQVMSGSAGIDPGHADSRAPLWSLSCVVPSHMFCNSTPPAATSFGQVNNRVVAEDVSFVGGCISCG